MPQVRQAARAKSSAEVVDEIDPRNDEFLLPEVRLGIYGNLREKNHQRFNRCNLTSGNDPAAADAKHPDRLLRQHFI